jgi:D-alanyl-D-alanine carboxypeptidase/D-alanyl-D-alanine-endopeptidase (penicillin-binding protein 4)
VLRSQPGDPAAAAAEEFAALLEKRRVDVRGEPMASVAPAGASTVAEVRGGTLAQATELTIAASDNDAAEVILRQLAVGAGRPGTFRDGVAVVGETLRKRGVDITGLVLRDGSGLSRGDRIAPLTLAQLIANATADSRTAGLVASLPVARFSGSLSNRFAKSEDAGGVVRAKTGTLTGVHSLAGYVTEENGAPIAFAVMADKTKDISGVETEAALDRVGEALARCACSLG